VPPFGGTVGSENSSVATNIKITSIKQLLPISAPASVQIDFVVLGILPDLVQIYASGVGDQIGGFVDKVDINPPENTYGTIITLAAGTRVLHLLVPTNRDQRYPG